MEDELRNRLKITPLLSQRELASKKARSSILSPLACILFS